MSMPVNWLKLLAVGVGAAVAALAGTINAALLQGAFPDDYNTQVLIIIYAMVILGGAGSLPGAVLGAFVVSVLMLEGLRPQTPIGLTGNGAGSSTRRSSSFSSRRSGRGGDSRRSSEGSSRSGS